MSSKTFQLPRFLLLVVLQLKVSQSFHLTRQKSIWSNYDIRRPVISRGSNPWMISIATTQSCVPTARRQQVALSETSTSSAETNLDTTSATSSTSDIKFDPKDGVKIFGRLAEKYIALDSSGGQCCYSGCSNCEYRLPGGGYIMADQSSSRPKWIPTYVQRNTNNKNHISKWSTVFFPDNSENDEKTTSLFVTRDEFISIIQGLEYSPPLGGPYVGASSASFDSPQSTALLDHFFTVLVGDDTKDKISKTKFSVRLKQLSKGEEGMTWQSFSSALGI